MDRERRRKMNDKALSQEPCDDAISREAVKELIKCGVSTDTYDDVEQVCKWIDALPSVMQKSETVTEFADRCRECGAKYGKLLEQKYGKWLIKEDSTSYVKTIPRRWAECSCCKWSMSPGYVDRYAFCPNCGAKMVEPQKSEDKE